jgi:hypothetical protein
MTNILGDVIARAGLTQFRCAETEKYPHVTFFFNDYREEPFEGENRLLVPSPTEVSTYDQKPEMSAHGVGDGVVERLCADDGETLIVVNFANGDMVGHTGNLEAAIRAVEVTDECVGRIVEATLARGGALIITADHGNAEQMWDPVHDCPHTAHTSYVQGPVPAGRRASGRHRAHGAGHPRPRAVVGNDGHVTACTATRPRPPPLTCTREGRCSGWVARTGWHAQRGHRRWPSRAWEPYPGGTRVCTCQPEQSA